jgi:hypothetical protein
VLNRRAATLIEVLVSLTLAGIVLGAATGSVLRQQRTHARVAGVAASDMQLRTAASLISSQLALIDASAGDLSVGEASDTAFQLRATIAVAVACDSSSSQVTFLPDPPDAIALAGFVALPRVGDSLWFLGDTAWKGTRIAGVAPASAVCRAPFASSGQALRVVLSGLADTIPAGAPLRVTRPVRYAFYRSGDGSWQLGLREWSETSGSFSAPQPVAGPFLRYNDGRRSRFRYFASTGEELSRTGFEASVSRIRLVAHTLSLARDSGQDSVRSDSVDVALQRGLVR